MTHDATGTSRIVRGKQRAKDIMKAGGYSDSDKAFRALPPMGGMFNSLDIAIPTLVPMGIQS